MIPCKNRKDGTFKFFTSIVFIIAFFDGLVKAIFVYDDYIKLILTFDDKPINIPTSDEIENMANSSDIQSSASPKNPDRHSTIGIF